MSKKPKVAIFYDWLNQWGGAERLLLDILQIFPQASLFTSVHQPNKTSWLPPSIKIKTSFLNKFKMFKTNSILSLLLQPIAIEQFDFSNFNILISISSMHGKALLTSPQTTHINYCLNPNRYLYKHSSLLAKLYQKIDFIYAQRPDYYLTISPYIQKQIKKYYQRSSTVIPPGTDLSLFKLPAKQNRQNYFLVVSRLVKHKKIDLAIKACQQLKIKLKIVGTGRHSNYFKHIANHQYVEFLGHVSDKELVKLYQQSQALICPQLEDFGLTAIEAQACGTPVIALNKGGYPQTIVHQKTGILFDQQTVTRLKSAIKQFQQLKFYPQTCSKNAHHFSKTNFMLNFYQQVIKLWQKQPKKIPTIT